MTYDPDTAAAVRGIVIVARQHLDTAQQALNASDEALFWLSEQLRNASIEPKPTTPWADNPQAAQIDALIGRAGRLTDAEVDALGAARGAAWGAAWDGAEDAARGAAWYAAEGAAWGAAEGAAWGAAWGAAGGAARYAAWGAAGDAARYAADVADALVVRDLIDEATPWNQAAYDLLVAPWAAVIGPAHPDDRRNNEG